MIQIHKLPTLYKRDTTGKIREWTMAYQTGMNPGTFTIAGIQGGKLVQSGLNTSEAKNVGRSNATTADEQAQKEAEAKWQINLDGEYFLLISEVDTYDKFKPMLAQDYTKRPQDSGWSQPKLDGIRCIARKDGLFTRAGKEITTCDHIFNELKPFFKEQPGMILDGELYNHELKSDFNKITSLVRKVKPSEEERMECEELVQYHVYDVYDPSFKDWNFQERISYVHIMIGGDSCKAVETTQAKSQDQLDALYSAYTEAGYEGQMVRNNTPYENKRSKNLLKRKEFITEEFEVVEVLEGDGNWKGYAKHFVLTDGDITFRSGVRGNFETLENLLNNPEQAQWVTCRYFDLTPDGVPRFPVVIDWGQGVRAD